MGAQGEAQVREFVQRLVPTPEQSEVERLLEIGDAPSLNRAYELERTSVSRAFNASRRSNASKMESLRTTGNFWEAVRRYNDPRGVSF